MDSDDESTRTEDQEIVYAPDGFDAYDALCSQEKPWALLPEDDVLTEAEANAVEAEQLLVCGESVKMVAGGPLYAKTDMLSYDMLCAVQAQVDVISRFKNAHELTPDAIAELSREYYKNEIRMQVVLNFRPEHSDDDVEFVYDSGSE